MLRVMLRWKKLSMDISYFKCYVFMVGELTWCTEPYIVLTINYFEPFGGGTHLAMPKTIYAPDTSSLKPGLGNTEGVLD